MNNLIIFINFLKLHQQFLINKLENEDTTILTSFMLTTIPYKISLSFNCLLYFVNLFLKFNIFIAKNFSYCSN